MLSEDFHPIFDWVKVSGLQMWFSDVMDVQRESQRSKLVSFKIGEKEFIFTDIGRVEIEDTLKLSSLEMDAFVGRVADRKLDGVFLSEVIEQICTADGRGIHYLLH